MHEGTGEVDYEDGSVTENTRATYPVEHISNCVISGAGPSPSNVIFLACDAFGVLPPIAKLTPEMAMYHFLSGYTAKLAGTEVGVNEPEATFSACFGEPFMPLNPAAYAKLLGERLSRHKLACQQRVEWGALRGGTSHENRNYAFAHKRRLVGGS